MLFWGLLFSGTTNYRLWAPQLVLKSQGFRLLNTAKFNVSHKGRFSRCTIEGGSRFVMLRSDLAVGAERGLNKYR